MSDYQLRITSLDANGQKYHRHPIELSFFDRPNKKWTEPGGFVVNSGSYKIEILCSEQQAEDCRNWRILLNGEQLKSRPEWSSREKLVRIPVESTLFEQLLGFAIFQVRMKNPKGRLETLSCPPIKIFFSDSELSKRTVAIARYVIEEGGDFLLKHREPQYDPTDKISGNTLRGSDVVSFVENIIQVYEFDIEYFRSNSRAKIKVEGRVDSFEKLRSFTGETLRFIATHPEELAPSSQSTGIRVGSLSFTPQRSWIQGDRMDRNVYENRIVLGFLRTVINHLTGLLKIVESNAIKSEAEEEKLEEQGLFDSSILIQRGVLYEHKKLNKLVTKLRTLFFRYKEFMKADPLPVNSAPEPTAIFLSIPAYNRIYNLLYSWFNLRDVKLVKASFFLEPTRTSRIYEYYCLVRLIREALVKNFKLIDQVEIDWLGKNSSKENINNVYCFSSEKGERLTLYYEPTIKGTLNEKTGLFLYRNSTGRLSDSNTGLYLTKGDLGEHYEPDYVLKYEDNNSGAAHYLLADAKFSKTETIIEEQLIKLIFKYQMSVSVAREADSIVGLSVFCGKDSSRETPPLLDVPNPITGKLIGSTVHVFEVRPGDEEFTQINGSLTLLGFSNVTGMP